jgi:hypothetical protein
MKKEFTEIRRRYIKVCSCNGEIFSKKDNSYFKSRLYRTQNHRPYTKEQELNSLEYFLLKKIINKNKEINFQRSMNNYLNLVIANRKEVEMINFICNKLYYYQHKILNKQDNITKLSLVIESKTIN